jgi:hypothetical protein
MIHEKLFDHSQKARGIHPSMRTFNRTLASIGIVIFSTLTSAAETLLTTELPVSVADGAREPSLSAMGDGRVLMSWTEPAGTGFAVKTAIADGTRWSNPQTVIEADDLFVNWADFPSAIALSDGTLAAHWLQINGEASYQYDVKIALSDDYGKTWDAPFILHDDRTQREHGFVTLLPDQNSDFTAIWLDGRSYDTYGSQDDIENAMQLRARSISSTGVMGTEAVLDARTCTCCQTSAVLTDQGSVLVVYRDRTPEEIRDISIVRKTGQGWSEPRTVGVDGWHIEGCPVNGPAIDAAGDNTVVAWFTAADDVPKVKVAFSNDDGLTFDEPLQIDNGAASGRVDVLLTNDGNAFVTWVEQAAQGETVFICSVEPQIGCEKPSIVAVSPRGRTVGFPRMALGNAGVLLAWTEPSQQTRNHPEGGTTLRTVKISAGDNQ